LVSLLGSRQHPILEASGDTCSERYTFFAINY
jgi:hypothetical protein